MCGWFWKFDRCCRLILILCLPKVIASSYEVKSQKKNLPSKVKQRKMMKKVLSWGLVAKKLAILFQVFLKKKLPSSTAYIRMFCSASSKNVSPQTTHCHYACGGVAEALAARRVKRSTFWFANALPNHICPLENAERLYFLPHIEWRQRWFTWLYVRCRVLVQWLS